MNEEQLDEYKRRREYEAAKRLLAQQVLSAEAFERLSNIHAANPSLYSKIIDLLVALKQAGRLPPGKLSEEQFKKLLARVLPRRRDTKIIRK